MSFTDRSSPSQAIVPLFTQGLTSGTEGVPVLTFHIHPTEESLLIFSSSSPPPCPRPFTTVHFCSTLFPLAWIVISAFLLGSCPPLLLLPEPEWSHHAPPVNASVAPLYTLQGKVLTPCLCLQTKCDCISSCSTSLCIPLPLIALLQPHFIMVSIRSPSFFFFHLRPGTRAVSSSQTALPSTLLGLALSRPLICCFNVTSTGRDFSEHLI